MYIWVLLATLMVALNFYNLPPRRDLENVYNETRVVTLANRFRHEHLAFKNATECEMINSIRTENSFNNLYSGNSEKASDVLDFEYTNKKQNLPIGYDEEHGQFEQISHNIVCVDEDDKTPKECKSAKRKYAISVVKLDDRWINKNLVLKTIEGASGEENIEVRAPVSILTNYLAKAAARTKFTGWVWYDGANYHLEGFANSYSVEAVKEKNDDGTDKKDDKGNYIYKAQFKKYEFPDGILTVLGQHCVGIPCLYAADVYKNSDVSGRCATLKAQP